MTNWDFLLSRLKNIAIQHHTVAFIGERNISAGELSIKGINYALCEEVKMLCQTVGLNPDTSVQIGNNSITILICDPQWHSESQCDCTDGDNGWEFNDILVNLYNRIMSGKKKNKLRLSTKDYDFYKSLEQDKAGKWIDHVSVSQRMPCWEAGHRYRHNPVCEACLLNDAINQLAEKYHIGYSSPKELTSVTIPLDGNYDTEYIESANNLSSQDLHSIIDFFYQGVRALVSRHISENLPDENGEQVLDVDISIEDEAVGADKMNPRTVTKIIQYQGGEIDVEVTGYGKIDLSMLSVDSLIRIIDSVE